MNKIYYQQVAKCTDDGKLEINDKETLEAYVNDLFNAPPAISKMEEMLRLGTACLKVYSKGYLYFDGNILRSIQESY